MQPGSLCQNHDLMSVMSDGIGKRKMASVRQADGRIPDEVIVNPAKSTSSRAKLHFLGLNTMPFLAHSSIYAIVCQKESLIFASHKTVSSTHLDLRGTLMVISS